MHNNIYIFRKKQNNLQFETEASSILNCKFEVKSSLCFILLYYIVCLSLTLTTCISNSRSYHSWTGRSHILVDILTGHLARLWSALAPPRVHWQRALFSLSSKTTRRHDLWLLRLWLLWLLKHRAGAGGALSNSLIRGSWSSYGSHTVPELTINAYMWKIYTPI